jgi:hypothetical protein
VSKVQDKRTKLTATFLNSIATAMVVAGAVVPFAAFTYELPGAASGQAIILVGVSHRPDGPGIFLVGWL